MIELNSHQLASLRDWFPPERPGYLVGPHVINTGYGQAWADRFPDPRALLAEVAGNYQFYGDPDAFAPGDIVPLLKGFIDCPVEFEPLLRSACPGIVSWDRVVYELDMLHSVSIPLWAEVRRLGEEDIEAVANLSSDLTWVTKTWGGAAGATASGTAWGAFLEGRLASAALPFFVGSQYEDLGVVTGLPYRGRGFSAACTYALCQDVLHRGKRVSWNTSTDNPASIRVAEKVGFRFARSDRLYVIGVDIPVE